VSGVRFIVSGRVQGVGFRWFVMREATRLDLAGHVRNLPDGSVEVVAEGPPAGLASLEAALRQGPSGARIQAVDKSKLSHQISASKPFEIT
jgi:acylphosphatase